MQCLAKKLPASNATWKTSNLNAKTFIITRRIRSKKELYAKENATVFVFSLNSNSGFAQESGDEKKGNWQTTTQNKQNRNTQNMQIKLGEKTQLNRTSKPARKKRTSQ